MRVDLKNESLTAESERLRARYDILMEKLETAASSATASGEVSREISPGGPVVWCGGGVCVWGGGGGLVGVGRWVGALHACVCPWAVYLAVVNIGVCLYVPVLWRKQTKQAVCVHTCKCCASGDAVCMFE